MYWPNEFPNGKKFNYIINYPEPFETTELLYFLPVEINNYTLVAVNTKEVKNISGKTFYNEMADYKYTGLVTEYLKLNKKQLENRDVIIVGDFNDNIKLCKKPKDKKRFESMIEEFNDIGLVSLYHTKNELNIFNCKEEDATRYDPQKKNDSSYKGDHIDYCFITKRLIECSKINIKNDNEIKRWKGLSDHFPIILEIK